MPGETFLTPAEQRAALDSMTEDERAALGDLFNEDHHGLIVAYARREFDVVVYPDGSQGVEPVGVVTESPTGVLSVSSQEVASLVTGGKSGTDLFLSFVVEKTRSTSPYEWQVYWYAQWGQSGSYWPAGMDCCNNYQDTVGVAWHGGLALYSDSKSGKYQAWCSGEPALNIYRSDVTANTGVGHSFNEWWDPDNCPMYWGSADNRIRESTWKNQISNVVMKYYHTWGSYNYSLTFSSTPSVTISPKTDQWSANLYLSFSH
jgi:hypothetical protein